MIDGENGVFLTGATGLVGSGLLPRLLAAHPDRSIYCLIRARDAAHLEVRRERLLEFAEISAEDAVRVVAVAGTLDADDLGLGAAYDTLARSVSQVMHAAASTKFTMPLDEALARNLGGTERVLKFAQRAQARGGVERFHYVSTAYITGDESGVFTEDDAYPRPTFRNGYEESKWEAERAVRELSGELPVTCYRPSIIVGDSKTGKTPHFRVLYDIAKWILSGKTNLIPCRPEIRADVVPIDYVCDAILALGALDETLGQSLHVTAGPQNAHTIRDLLYVASITVVGHHNALGLPPRTKPRVVSPDTADTEELRNLFKIAEQVMKTHVPYMLCEQLFDPAATVRLLSGTGIVCPDLRAIFPTLLLYGLERDFESN